LRRISTGAVAAALICGLRWRAALRLRLPARHPLQLRHLLVQTLHLPLAVPVLPPVERGLAAAARVHGAKAQPAPDVRELRRVRQRLPHVVQL